MKFKAAFLSGILGGVAMTVVMAIARTLGMRLHFEMMLGTMMGGPPDATRWSIGLVMHLILSGLIGLGYAFGFEYVTHRAGWLAGVGFSIIHIAVAGTLLGLVSTWDPVIPEIMPAPGPFMANFGIIYTVTFMALHFMYGAIVGVLYGPALMGGQKRAK
jgi:hypothetical protein